MKYISYQEGLRQSALRLEAKGLWQTDMGFDEHARRTFRKAARKRATADFMAFRSDEPDNAVRAVALLAKCIADGLLSGNAQVYKPIITKK